MWVTRGICAAVALILAPVSAWAEDVALIYGDRGQSPFFQAQVSLPSSGFTGPLEAAGFTVIEPARRDAASMRRAALEVEALLEQGAVERLLIVVYGPFANNPRDTWALSNDAAGASAVTIGATGLSLNALSDMAERSGRGVIMLAPGRAAQSLGAGLLPGLGEITSVGSVTYMTGPADALGEVLTRGLLDPAKSLSAVAGDMPDTVSVAGFVSPGASFMGEIDAGGDGGDEMMQAGYWQAIRDVDTIAGYRLYLRAYPKSANRAVAEKRIAFLRGEPERLAQVAEEALKLSDAAKRGIQRDLKILGHYDLGIDGKFGRGSRAGIAAWQLGNNFDETGFMTGNQLFVLREQAKERQVVLAEEEAERKRVEARKDQEYWDETGADGSEAGLRAYLGRYGQGAFADEARAALGKIDAARAAEVERVRDEAWAAARSGGTVDHYRAFLRSYPSGKYARDARQALSAIERAEAGYDAIAQAEREEDGIAGSGVTRLMIEQRLETAGAQPGAVDGQFDAQTRDAIRWYQETRDIPVSGYVSRLTMMRLMAGR